MKRLFLFIVLMTATVCLSFGQAGTNLGADVSVMVGQTSDQNDIDVLVTVFTPLTVTPQRDLDFGNVGIGASNDVSAAASNSGVGESGHFAVGGNANATVNVQGSTSQVTLSGPSATGVTWDPSLSVTGNQALDANGALDVYVGGTLSVATGTDPGDYGTTYTLTVDYVSL